MGLHGPVQRPARGVGRQLHVQIHARGAEHPEGRAAGACAARGRGVHAFVDDGEGHVIGVLVQHGADFLGGVPGVVHVQRAYAQAVQRLQAPAADDFFRGLGAGAEHALHGDAVIGQDGAVGEGHEDLFLRQVAVEEVAGVGGPGGLAGTHHAFQHGADIAPDLAPAVRAGLAQRLGVLAGSQEGDIAIVVDQAEVFAPPDGDGKARAQRQAHGVAQGLRPAVRRSQGRGRPVVGTHACRHFAALRQESKTVF